MQALSPPWEGCCMAEGPARWASLYSIPELWKSSVSDIIQLPLALRIPTLWGGNDDQILGVTSVFDTGCDIQTIHRSDLPQIAYDPNTYQAGRSVIPVNTAAGTVYRTAIDIQLCVLDIDTNPPLPITPWFSERAYITDDPTIPRLSGAAMYNHLWFGLSPLDTTRLYAGADRHALFVRMNP